MNGTLAARRPGGLLDRGACVALQREAGALLLLTGRDRSEATGKLFEYLEAGRPILAEMDRRKAEAAADRWRRRLPDLAPCRSAGCGL